MRRVSATFLVPNTPILPDTDVDTSIELDKSVGALQESKKVNFTKSVFEIPLQETEIKHLSDNFNAKETELRQEIKDWHTSLSKALADLKKAKEKHPVVDESILSKERREFLEKEPDYPQFLRRLREFRSSAVKFMDNDMPELLTMQQNIEEVCSHRMDLVKHNFLVEKSMDMNGIRF